MKTSEADRARKKKWRDNNKDQIKKINAAYNQRMIKMRITRAYRQNNPEKYHAQTKLGNAVRDGKILKKPCRDCGAKNVQAHHRDYFKLLDVVWLCPQCHKNQHSVN